MQGSHAALQQFAAQVAGLIQIDVDAGIAQAAMRRNQRRQQCTFGRTATDSSGQSSVVSRQTAALMGLRAQPEAPISARSCRLAIAPTRTPEGTASVTESEQKLVHPV
ncbi:hypothetical protein CT3_25120 [Comamonas terrigena NBRC 13299]|nr:hypothetical protein CT3_25120 [Comamonas terrigena NBRC 13299]